MAEPTAPPPTSPAALARRAWGRMFDFLMRTAPERTASLGRRGLTPNDARALGTLDPAEGRAMRALAEAWRCDASHATQIVDRLERLGLAERRTVAHDRRVKLVVLTAAGAATKRELLAEFHTPPPALLALDPGDLAALDRVLETLGHHADAAAPSAARGDALPVPPRAAGRAAGAARTTENGEATGERRGPARGRAGTRAPTR